MIINFLLSGKIHLDVRITDKLDLIFFAKLLTLFRTFKFYIVRRLCPKFY